MTPTLSLPLSLPVKGRESLQFLISKRSWVNTVQYHCLYHNLPQHSASRTNSTNHFLISPYVHKYLFVFLIITILNRVLKIWSRWRTNKYHSFHGICLLMSPHTLIHVTTEQIRFIDSPKSFSSFCTNASMYVLFYYLYRKVLQTSPIKGYFKNKNMFMILCCKINTIYKIKYTHIETIRSSDVRNL